MGDGVAEGRIPVRGFRLLGPVAVPDGVAGDVVGAGGRPRHGGLEAGGDRGEGLAVELEVAGPTGSAEHGLQREEASLDRPRGVLGLGIRPQGGRGGAHLVDQAVGIAAPEVGEFGEPVVDRGPVRDRQAADLADDGADLGPADAPGLEGPGQVRHACQDLCRGGQHPTVGRRQACLQRQQVLERQASRALRRPSPLHLTSELDRRSLRHIEGRKRVCQRPELATLHPGLGGGQVGQLAGHRMQLASGIADVGRGAVVWIAGVSIAAGVVRVRVLAGHGRLRLRAGGAPDPAGGCRALGDGRGGHVHSLRSSLFENKNIVHDVWLPRPTLRAARTDESDWTGRAAAKGAQPSSGWSGAPRVVTRAQADRSRLYPRAAAVGRPPPSSTPGDVHGPGPLRHPAP